MEPIYFGSGNRLFGMRAEPSGVARETAILICSPWGMEYMRSYRCLHLLSARLAGHGFEVLRFDYSCTGDSMGFTGEARVERWIEDIGFAVRELRELSGAARVCILGLRLGGLLAIEAVNQGLPADFLALWDLPLSGQTWLEQLHSADSAMYAGKNRYLPSQFRLQPQAEQLAGVPWPGPVNEAVARLRPETRLTQNKVLAMNSVDTIAAPIGAQTRIQLPDEAHWSELAWLTTPWAPADSSRLICDTLDRWL